MPLPPYPVSPHTAPPSQYPPAVFVLSRAVEAMLADASATLLAFRQRATLLLVAAVLFGAVAPHRLPILLAAIAWAVAATLAGWPAGVRRGIDVDDFWKRMGEGEGSREDAEAQLVSDNWAAFQDHRTAIGRTSTLCCVAMILAVAAVATLAI